MLRKVFVCACAALLLASGPSWGQYTGTTATDISIASPVAGDNRLTLKADPYLMADNRVGTLVKAWSTNASIDSIMSYTGGKDRYWEVSIARFRADSTATLRIEEKELPSNRVIAVYTQEIDWGYKTEAHIENDVGGSPIGLNLSVCGADEVAAVSAAVRSTWRWYLYLSQKTFMRATESGSLATYSAPGVYTMTILSNDTLAVGPDTSWTAAIPGQYGYITLFNTMTTTDEDTTDAIYALTYQVKISDGEWAGSASGHSLAAFALLDSVAAPRGETRAYWPATTPADSIRFGVFNKSELGRLVITKIQALWRD